MKPNQGLHHAAIVLFVVFGCTFGRQIDLSGFVCDISNAPVPNVIVTLAPAGLADTTDNNGAYHLQSASNMLNGRIDGSFLPRRILVNGGTLRIITMPTDQAVTVDAFTCTGRRLVSLSVAHGGQDAVDVPIRKLTMGCQGVFYFRVRTGSRCEVVRYCLGAARLSVPAGKIQSSISRKQGVAAAVAPDTLRFRKAGYCTKRMECADSIGVLDTVRMYSSDLGFTTANYPRVDGSTSTQPLAMIIACKLLGCSYGWVLASDGSKMIVASSTTNPQKADSINSVLVVHHGTHQAYVRVIKDTSDLGLIARWPSPDETATADSIGVSLDVKAAAHDAFVMIVNEKNKTGNLAIQDIRDIYTGVDTNWQKLGWINARIKPYQREANSGSQELFLSLVMKTVKPISAPSMVLMGMMGPINQLSTDTLGICYSVYFFKEMMAPTEKIVSLSIEGVAPNYDNILSNRYPLNADVALVVRKNTNRTSNAAKLREFILSEEGQAVVKESGYVPVFNP